MTNWQVMFLIAAVCFGAIAFIQLHKATIERSEVARYFVCTIIALLFVTLTACSTPATRTQTVEVKVPVAVQPIKPEQVPTPPAALGPRPDSLSAAADILLSKWCEAVAYTLKADPLLRVSAGQQPATLPKYPECER